MSLFIRAARVGLLSAMVVAGSSFAQAKTVYIKIKLGNQIRMVPVEVESFPMEGSCSTSSVRELSEDPNCYSLTSIDTELLKGESALFQFDGNAPPPIVEQTRPIGAGGPGGLGDVLNLFDWIWRFIEKNKPVVNKTIPPYAAALPKDHPDWSDLEKWSEEPQSVEYSLHVKNKYNADVVDVVYSIMFMYNGQYNGKGHYLNNVQVVPRKIRAAWGYQLDFDAKVLAVVNFNTKDDPLAGIQLMTTHRIKNVLVDTSESRSYIVRGDGKYSEVVPKK